MDIIQLPLDFDPPTKHCPKCARDLSVDMFHRHKSRKDGRYGHCKKCRCAASKAYALANKEAVRVYQAAYRAANADQLRAYERQRYAANRERRLLEVKAWADANRARKAAAGKQRYRANREKALELATRWQAANPTKVREKNARWRKAHPLNVRQSGARRRARERAATIGPVDFQAVYDREQGLCYLCKSPEPISREELHFDHIIPLCRGGAHSNENLAPTHARCNLRKGASILPR